MPLIKSLLGLGAPRLRDAPGTDGRAAPAEPPAGLQAEPPAAPPPVPLALERRLAALEDAARCARRFAVEGYWRTADRLDELTLPGKRLECPICGRAEAREALEARVDACMFGGGRLERYECPGCGCVFGPSKYLELDPELMRADYALLYLDYAEGDTTEAEVRAFRSLSPARDGLYLNWGCGRWNRTIAALLAEGYDVWGYEPSAPPELGAAHVVGSRDAVTGPFRGIFSNNVIEHLVRPVEEFRFFHSRLVPGGRMAHASPCYRYAYANTRFHVVFLTGDAPHVLAERSGFRVAGREEDGEFMNCVFERL
jgi:hypothetical protein